LLACAPALQRFESAFGSPGAAVDPLLWRAEHPARGTLYLFGSVHLNDRRIEDLGPGVDAAWRESDELVVEIDTSTLSPADSQAVVARWAVLQPPQTVADALPPGLWQRVAAHLHLRGIPESHVAHMKPWFLYLVLVQIEFERAGYLPEHGVDELFIRAATGTKPIVGLETMESQLQVFDAMSVSLQHQLLAESLDRSDAVAGEVAALIDAWSRGDESRLSTLVFAPLEKNPELAGFYDRLFYVRNRAMTEAVVELARDGKTRFVVVGAGHMLGPEGIPALLAARGWTVSRRGGGAR